MYQLQAAIHVRLLPENAHLIMFESRLIPAQPSYQLTTLIQNNWYKTGAAQYISETGISNK